MAPPRKKKREEEVMRLPTDNSNSGVIRFEVDKISTMDGDDERFSKEIEVGGVSWRAQVCKDEVDDKEYLSVYLCCLHEQSTVWSTDMDLEYILVHSYSSSNVTTGKGLVTFDRNIMNWGDDVLEWKDLMDEEKGFIKEDRITIEVHFSITDMKGIRILPRVDFMDPKEPRHDVAFLIGGEKIYANKGYLSLHSSVFNTMFYGESVEKNKKEIELKDVGREEFLEMLRVIYPSYQKVTDDNVRSLLNLGDRFKIKLLLDLVEEHLISSASMLLDSKLLISDQYKLAMLQEHCHTQVKKRENEDKSRSSDDMASGFIHFEMSNVTASDSFDRNSSAIEVLGTPWSLKVKKRASSPLVFFLYNRKSDSNIWSYDVSNEFTIVNTGGEGRHIVKKFKQTFNHEIDHWGFKDVISWKDLIDEEKGFIKDDKITIEARFTLSNIIGMRKNPHVDFTDPKEPYHDVALVIEGEKIYVSKQILAVHSPVFKAMFYGDFMEKNKEEIEIKDVDRKEFIEMLNLIYPSNKKITDANAEYLLKLADRFQFKMIIDQVEKFLIDSTTLSVSAKLKLSDQYRLVTLQDHCLDKFKTTKHIADLKKTDEYKELSDKAKATLLEKVIKLAEDT